MVQIEEQNILSFACLVAIISDQYGYCTGYDQC